MYIVNPRELQLNSGSSYSSSSCKNSSISIASSRNTELLLKKVRLVFDDLYSPRPRCIVVKETKNVLYSEYKKSKLN